MSCNLRVKMLDALLADAQGNIAKAKANVEVYCWYGEQCACCYSRTTRYHCS